MEEVILLGKLEDLSMSPPPEEVTVGVSLSSLSSLDPLLPLLEMVSSWAMGVAPMGGRGVVLKFSKLPESAFDVSMCTPATEGGGKDAGAE